MSADDVIERAAEVLLGLAVKGGGYTVTVDRTTARALAVVLHDAGLLAKPKDEIEWTDDKGYVVAQKSDPLIQHALTGAMGEVARRGATTWRLRGEFIDALARSYGRFLAQPYRRFYASEAPNIKARTAHALVAHLDAEGEL